MRELTGATRIRIRRPRPELTGDTRIRLSQIKDLAAWIEDRRYQNGEISQTTGLMKTPGGWVVPPHSMVPRSQEPIENTHRIGGGAGSSKKENHRDEKELPQKAVEIKKGEKPPIKIRTTEAELKKIPTIKIEPHNYTDEQLKEMYKSFPVATNKKDGTRVEFTHRPYGKMIGHQGYDFRKLVPQIRNIYETSEPIFDSNHRSTETRSDGSKHKEHSNINCYRHFLGKIKDEEDNQTYYVRLTTQEINEPNPDKANNQLHSSFISDINLYKEEATNGRSHSDMDREAKPIRGFDEMLAQFFEEVKQNKPTDDRAPQHLVRLVLVTK